MITNDAEEKIDDNIHKFTSNGEAGDFLCKGCGIICNYRKGLYCCNRSRRKNDREKQSRGHYMKWAYHHGEYEKLIKAMVEGKTIQNENGSCHFCRNNKAHEQGWCAKQTQTKLLEHVFFHKYLPVFTKTTDQYIDLRKLEIVEDYEHRAAVKYKEVAQRMETRGFQQHQIKLKLIRYRRRLREQHKEVEDYESNDVRILRKYFDEGIEKMKKWGIERLEAGVMDNQIPLPPLNKGRRPRKFPSRLVQRDLNAFKAMQISD